MRNASQLRSGSGTPPESSTRVTCRCAILEASGWATSAPSRRRSAVPVNVRRMGALPESHAAAVRVAPVASAKLPGGMPSWSSIRVSGVLPSRISARSGPCPCTASPKARRRSYVPGWEGPA
ncbi:MAG TPA: hypothetical protein VK358_00325, partial [Longimicrobium sp.]|nr:hypothetical protein [Longimicrobium sp.]